jgi:hypothetical protein
MVAMQDPSDPLSSLARQILKLIPNPYTKLVVETEGPPEARKLLQTATPDNLLIGVHKNADESKSLLCALWLYHDFLDESHRISQSIATPTGSFWHAIMHRREGDFSNSKYWYARCVNHPALHAIAAQAATFVHPYPADKSLLRLLNNGFDPDAFVDLVERVHADPNHPHHALAIELQRAEWHALFTHCTRAATS